MSENREKRRAVLVSVEPGEKSLRLRLDDAISESSESKVWEQAEVYTWKDIEEKSFDDLKFDEKELADFGYAILARLYAYKKRNEF